MGLTDALYKLARASADERAVSKGPKAVAKRAVRKTIYRAEGRATRRTFRRFGL